MSRQNSNSVRQRFAAAPTPQVKPKLENAPLRQSLTELDSARAHYFDLYERAPVGYCSLSESGLIEQANLTAALLLGVDRDTLIGQALARFIDQQDQHLYDQQRHQLLSNAVAQTCDLRLIKRDGTPFWGQLTMSFGNNEALAPVLRVVLSDVSVRKLAEQRLDQMSHALAQQVNLHKQQLRTLSMELTLTEVRERRLLAEELHDNLGQLLAVIQIKLTLLAESLAPTPVHQIVKLVEQAVASARNIIRQLSPPALHTQGLQSALEDMAEDLQRMYQLSVQIDTQEPLEPLVAGLHAVLHRSVRELLVNVAKHANVNAARLTLKRQGQRLLLTVSDCGRGFDTARFETNTAGHYGFGLSSIYERITAIGGEMEIHSVLGQGTMVTLTAPYEVARHQPPSRPTPRRIAAHDTDAMRSASDRRRGLA